MGLFYMKMDSIFPFPTSLTMDYNNHTNTQRLDKSNMKKLKDLIKQIRVIPRGSFKTIICTYYFKFRRLKFFKRLITLWISIQCRIRSDLQSKSIFRFRYWCHRFRQPWKEQCMNSCDVTIRSFWACVPEFLITFSAILRFHSSTSHKLSQMGFF